MIVALFSITLAICAGVFAISYVWEIVITGDIAVSLEKVERVTVSTILCAFVPYNFLPDIFPLGSTKTRLDIHHFRQDWGIPHQNKCRGSCPSRH